MNKIFRCFPNRNQIQPIQEYNSYVIVEDEFLFKCEHVFKSLIKKDVIIDKISILIKFFQIESKTLKEEFKEINVVTLKFPDSDIHFIERCKIALHQEKYIGGTMPINFFIEHFCKLVKAYDKFYERHVDLHIYSFEEIENYVLRFYCCNLKDHLIEYSNRECLNRMHISNSIKKTLKQRLDVRYFHVDNIDENDLYENDEGYKFISMIDYMKHINMSKEELVKFAYEYVLEKIDYL